jgi:fibronectin-binding autotransporter adhesin
MSQKPKTRALLMRKPFVKSILVAGALAGSLSLANAQNVYWIGNTGSNTTSDASLNLNWTTTIGGGNDTPTLPTSTDNVIFVGLNGPLTNVFGVGYVNLVQINSDVSWGRIQFLTNGLPSGHITRLTGSGKITLNGVSGEIITVNLHNSAFNPIISNNVELAVLDNRINVNGGRTLTMTGNISETGAGVGTRLVKTNGGTLRFTGVNNLTAGVTIAGGTFDVNGDVGLGVNPVSFVPDYIRMANNTTLTLRTNGSSTGGNFDLGNRGITLGTTSNFVQSAAGVVTLLPNTITSGGADSRLVHNGAGTLVLQGPQDISGGDQFAGLRILQGTVRITEDASLGVAPGAFTAGSILITNGTLSFDTGASFTFNPNRGIQFGNGALNTVNQRLINLNVLTNAGLGAGANVNIDISQITESGTGHALLKSGPGTLTITGTAGAPAWSGGTRIDAGTLAVDSANKLGAGELGFNGGTLLADFTDDLSSRKIYLSTNNNNGGTINVTAGNTITYNSVIANLHSNQVSAGGLTKGGPGTLVLGAVNVYGGTTIIRDGTLSVTVNEALGSQAQGFNTVLGTNIAGRNAGTATNLVISKGSLVLNGTTQTVRAVTLADNNVNSTPGSTASIVGPGRLILQNNLTYNAGNSDDTAGAVISAEIELGNGDRTITVDDSTAAADDLTISGTIIGQEGFDRQRSFTKGGLGTLVLNAAPGANNYSNTTINAGVIKLGANDQLPNGRTVTIQSSTVGGTAVAGTLDLNGNSDTIGALTIGGGTAGPEGSIASAQVIDSVGGGTLTLGGNVTYNTGAATNHQGTAIISANLNLGGASRRFIINNSTNAAVDLNITGNISGAGFNIIKTNAGVLQLAGTTTIANLIIDGGGVGVTGTLNGNVDVNFGGLGGTGTINGNVIVDNGAAIAPGASPGTLTINGDLVLSDLTVLAYELDVAGVIGSGVNDLLSITGNLTLDGILNVDGLSNFGGGTYRLMNVNGSITDNGVTIGTLTGNASGFNPGDFSIVVGANTVDLVVVPEPSTVALAGIGAALLGLHVIRRRRNS